MPRNNFPDRTRRSLLLGMAAGGASIVLPSIGRAATAPGISKTEIKIGAFLPLQGGYAAGAAQMYDGTDAYFQHVNDTGGVHGRKINWIVENDSYNPQQTMTVIKKLIDRDQVFAIVSTLGTATNMAALPFIVQRKVPLINPASNNDRLTDPIDPYVFGVLPTAANIGNSLGKYAIETLNAKKVAILYQNDPFGRDPRDSIAALLKEKGLELVADANYVPTDIDLSSQVISLKNADPDTVIMICVPKHGALFMKEANRLGWNAKFLSHNTMADPVAYQLGGDALDGLIVQLFTATESMDTPAVKEANQLIHKYHPKTQPGYWTSLGMAGANIFVEALRRIGPDVTREALVDTLYKFDYYEPGVMPPIEWNKEHHGGSNKFGFAQWRKGGQLEVVQNW